MNDRIESRKNDETASRKNKKTASQMNDETASQMNDEIAGFSASGGISFEEYLDQYGTLTYTNVGISMLPLLRQGKDLFTVEKKGSKRCSAGDVVLYRRPPKAYVLHRIIKVRPEDYVILGDNCVSKEYGITDEDIIGIMTGFVRNGREHHVTDLVYRVYSAIWMHTAGLRIFLKKSRYYAGRAIRKVISAKQNRE